MCAARRLRDKLRLGSQAPAKAEEDSDFKLTFVPTDHVARVLQREKEKV